jgi:hypothetical protein
MNRTFHRLTVLAIGSLLFAGCGGSDQAPHPIDQPGSPADPTGSPAPLNPSARSPGELSASGQLAEEELDEATRRGFWTGSSRRRSVEEWTMRQTIVDALTRIGQAAVPSLVTLLDEPKAQVRAEAVLALARIGPEAQDAVPRLIELVKQDPDERVRKNAVRALGQIGPAAGPAVPLLIEQLRVMVDAAADGESPVRSAPGAGRPKRTTFETAPTNAP